MKTFFSKSFLLITIIFLFTTNSTVIAQKHFIVESKLIAKADTSLVFFPENYFTKRSDSFPLVILLHGYGGDYKQWNSITDLQKLANKYNFIISCPDGLKDSWYLDSPIQRNSKFESFFIKEYIPIIKSTFRIDSSNIFISGLSMGGHGAMYLFLRNSNIFASAGSTSGTLDLNASSLKFSSLSNKLGEYYKNQKIFTNYSAISQLDSIKFTDKPIIFDCGNRDHLYESNLKFKYKCDSLYINAFFFSSPGRHNRLYWKESILWHFEFFNKLYLTSKKSKKIATAPN